MEIDWNQDDYKPDVYEKIPPGHYLAMIEDEQIKDNSKGTGELLVFTFQIIDGEFKGRKIKKSLNIRHEEVKTENIARAQLNSIKLACNKPVIKNTLELQGTPMVIVVAYRQGSDYPDVKGFLPATTHVQPVQKEITGSKRSWR